jgi:hypothetical protein
MFKTKNRKNPQLFQIHDTNTNLQIMYICDIFIFACTIITLTSLTNILYLGKTRMYLLVNFFSYQGYITIHVK